MIPSGSQVNRNGSRPARSCLASFRRYAVDLGCAGVPAAAAAEIRFDEQYVPTFRERLLRSFGSASDRARLVTAYVTALLTSGANHPGFLVLDEPLQQNPDQDHRELFEKFLLEQAKIDRQVIIFTSLNADQIARLKAGGVFIRELEGRFLRRADR